MTKRNTMIEFVLKDICIYHECLLIVKGAQTLFERETPAK